MVKCTTVFLKQHKIKCGQTLEIIQHWPIKIWQGNVQRVFEIESKKR